MSGGGIGGVQSGVGHVGLGQDVQNTTTTGQTPEAQTAWVRAAIDGIGENGRAPDIRPDIRVGSAQDAPRLDQARTKSDVEKFISAVGKGIKSLFTAAADKIANLFKPQPQYNLNLGNAPPAKLTREPFVPLPESTGPVIGSHREAVPKSVSALTELQKEVSSISARLYGLDDPALRNEVRGPFFRGKSAGIADNVSFVNSHVDFRGVAEDVIAASADAIMTAARDFEDFLVISGRDAGMGVTFTPLGDLHTAEATANAAGAHDKIVHAVFDIADRILDALYDTDGWVAGLSDDLLAFTEAKMEIIKASECPLPDQAALARSLLTNDFLLRGVNSGIASICVGMDLIANRVPMKALDVVTSLLNGKAVHEASAQNPLSSSLYNDLRDKHQGARLDNFLQALGMPAEYRKDA